MVDIAIQLSLTGRRGHAQADGHQRHVGVAKVLVDGPHERLLLQQRNSFEDLTSRLSAIGSCVV